MREQELDGLFDIARFGIEVERFVTSDPIGKRLMEKAQREHSEGVLEFQKVDPSDTEAVRAVQDKMKLPVKFLSWLAEELEAGNVAEKNLADAETESDL
jgi:hypothetical protein